MTNANPTEYQYRIVDADGHAFYTSMSYATAEDRDRMIEKDRFFIAKHTRNGSRCEQRSRTDWTVDG